MAALIRAMPSVVRSHPDAVLEIVGGGPQAGELHKLADDLGIGRSVVFHGRLERHQEVERILARGTVGLAPYQDDANTYTRFADPGKLKAYLAAGLPIVMTTVPPNARELERAEVAILSGPDPEALASSICLLLADEQLWGRYRQQALEYAKRFDWNAILERGLGDLGWQ